MTVWGQINDDCSKGNDKPQEVNDPTKEQVGEASSSWQLSYDPNEIIGPAGYDSVRWVSINDVLNYTILFENDPEFATAAAQKVDVRFDFPNKAWMKGFGIGGYSFANMSFPVAKPSNAYQQRIDLRDSLGYYVDLIGGLDVARQQGFWTFSTIDPETGYAPWQAERGLLPVNDETHVGEGFVTFQLKPYEGLKTGDTISIQANIVFDQNDTIPTNRWCNKIDAGMPESKIEAPLLSPQEGDEPRIYQLSFTAKDDEGGSGVKHLLLYMANHNGIYEEIDTVAVDSVLLFPVETGKQYKLYSIAVDNTGNREPAKMEPDIILNFNQAPTDIALSDTIFQDDLASSGYIGKLSSTDTEDNKTFTYALAEGEGAIHNDLFKITDDLLQTRESFKCAADTTYFVRISTTDDGGLSFSKSFVLHMNRVLGIPKADTTAVSICEGDVYLFHEREYDKAGVYTYVKDNDFTCDSVYRLILTVMPRPETPLVKIENDATLVSSAVKGNQWFMEDGTPIDGATDQKFTPTEDGTYYVATYNGSCYSLPSRAYHVHLSDKMDLKLHLAQGWNWVSSNLSDAAYRDAKGFLEPITELVDRLIGQTEELTNDPDHGLQGNLTSISPMMGYKLQVKQDVDNIWHGHSIAPETMNIPLSRGWNWLGYIQADSRSLNDALTHLHPSENDVLKTEDAFAIYNNGTWHGDLTAMHPGHGYMYYAVQPTTFTYPSSPVYPALDEEQAAVPHGAWQYDAHRYTDNTTVVGQLMVNDAPVLEGIYTVGAFCNEECRGIGNYVDGVLFLTIHGDITSNQTVALKAYNSVTGQEQDIVETIHFDGEQKGSYNSPLLLHATAPDDINDIATAPFTIYPRPLRSRLFVKGDTERISAIKVLTTGGSVCLAHNGYTDNGIDVSELASGVYIVAIITNGGSVFYEKVIIS